ncbi:MAG: cysteine desulfurase [Rhodospirillaceae bacterium]|nr:cysteine desulfurase [Rhodospirillaceae bacterium]
MSDYVYLDHNATTLVRPEAARAVTAVISAVGNPSSVHGPGRAARKTMEEARRAVARLLNAEPADVIFTSGGTEANNLALEGSGRTRRLVSAVEHPSVLAGGGEVIPVDHNGHVDLDRLEERLLADDTPALVSVMLANNETGVIAPIGDVVAIAHRHGALVHCDAIQAAGKIAVDVIALGVDMMTISAHKIGGPSGAGALIVPGISTSSGAEIRGMQFGGGQERGYRVGTENLVGISGLGAAAAAAHAGLQDFARLADLRDAIEQGVKGIEPRTTIMGEDVQRLPNTTCLTMPGVDSQTQVMAFDLAGVGISAGSACSSGKTKASGVLKAMNMSDEVASSAVRVSLGWPSTAQDVKAFLAAWRDIYGRQNIDKISSPAA